MAVLQIVFRNIGELSFGLSWGDEFTSMAVLWITLVGAMIAVRQKGHIRMDFTERYLPPRWQKLTAIIANLSAATVCLVVCYFSINLVVWEFKDSVPGIGVIPSWLLVSIIPLACFVMGLRFVISIFVESEESLEPEEC